MRGGHARKLPACLLARSEPDCDLLFSVPRSIMTAGRAISERIGKRHLTEGMTRDPCHSACSSSWLGNFRSVIPI